MTVKGDNHLHISPTSSGNAGNAAVINVGEGLTIVGKGVGLGTSELEVSREITLIGLNNSILNGGACIGSDGGEKSSAYITIGSGVNVVVTSCIGAGIGSGGHGSTIGDITIGNNAIVGASGLPVYFNAINPLGMPVVLANNNINWGYGAAIGSGYGDAILQEIFISQMKQRYILKLTMEQELEAVIEVR